MAHPFEKIFEKQLRKSTAEENFVTAEAEALRKRGYDPREIYRALKHFHSTLIQDEDLAVTAEALEEFESYGDDE